MSIKKTPAGWLVDLQPGGRIGRRFRKTLPTKAEALAYEAWLKNKVREAPEWAQARKDSRRLLDLVEAWYQGHGVHLRNGPAAKVKLEHLCSTLGNPMVWEFDASVFSEYRANFHVEVGQHP